MNASSRFIATVLLGISAFSTSIAYADHEGPERVVDGKYVVILSLLPAEEGMNITFFFRDTKTGRAPATVVRGSVAVADANTHEPIIADAVFTASEGRGEVPITFPRDGLYSIALLFSTADAPGTLHKPEPWQLWAPGLVDGELPARGLSEWLGLASAGTVMVLLAVSLLRQWRRKTRLWPE